jgi:septum formation protein
MAVNSMRNKIRIVLASGSPRRDAILNQIGLPHIIAPSGIDEKVVKVKGLASYVKRLAVLKAEDVASLFKDAIIIGADTMVIVDGNVLGKPKDKDDAARMLGELSGRTHSVMTGLCVIDTGTGRKVVSLARTKVRFRKLDMAAIQEYINTGEPMDKAGAYAIQGRGAALIESISGDFYNVVGLPVPALMDALERLGALPGQKNQ